MRSATSQLSKYALRELNFAEEKGKRFVIIHIDDSQLSDEFRFLYGLADTIDWNSQPQREKLLRDLQKWNKDENLSLIDGLTNDTKSQYGKEGVRLQKELRKAILRPIEQNGKWGFFDETYKVVIPCQWNDADDFDDDLAPVKDSNGMWGYIDKGGILVIPCQWTYEGCFFDSLARVQGKNDKYGFIDKTGKIVIPCQWNNADTFFNGLAQVENANGRSLYINKLGKIVNIQE